MSESPIGVLGATSIVGTCLLRQLIASERQVLALSRQVISIEDQWVTWHLANDLSADLHVSSWISLAPIWVTLDYLSELERCGVERIVVLSSTSRFTKLGSSEERDRTIAHQLAEAESRLISWAEARGVDWCILRPTLIYGLGRDGNVSEIARMIRRYRLFPLFGKGLGRRQPVHADDVAQACVAALTSADAIRQGLNLSGGETLTYREMVQRIFSALGLKPRFVTVPLSLFRLGVCFLRRIPRYRHWRASMAERMNQDMVFDHAEAERVLEFRPRGFDLKGEDLPFGG